MWSDSIRPNTSFPTLTLIEVRTTERFKGDYKRLTDPEKEEFRRVVLDDFIPALERQASEPGAGYPPRLRVKGVEGAPGIWEMTWSFTDPDGRATFEWIKIDEEAAIRWRRVGSHAIFSAP